MSSQNRVEKNPNAANLTITWGTSQEAHLLLINEAHRRFMEQTNNDAQAARTLTLAWAMIESRRG